VILVVGIVPAKLKAMNHDVIYAGPRSSPEDITVDPSTERDR
jgi:hypothetical protein